MRLKQKWPINKTFFIFHPILMKPSELVFTKFQQNWIKHKKVLWKDYIFVFTQWPLKLTLLFFQSSHLYQIKRMYGLWFVIVILICDCNFGKQTSFGSPPDSEDDIDIQSYLDVNILNNFKISGEKWVCGKKITDMYLYNLWKFSKNDLLVDLLFPLEREQLQMNKFCWVLSVKR